MQVFSDQLYRQFTGQASLDDLFGVIAAPKYDISDITFDSNLLPNTNGKLLAESLEQKAVQWLTDTSVLAGVNELLSISEVDTSLAQELAVAAQPGCWTRIDLISEEISVIPYPPANEIGLIFDTETFVTAGNDAIIATAISHKAIYIWLCDSWDGVTAYSPTRVNLGNVGRLIVAHNASFDFTKIFQRYQLNNPVKALCTLAMAKPLLGTDTATYPLLGTNEHLNDIACKLDLISLYNYLTGETISETAKDIRNIFVKAKNFSEFISHGHDLKVYAITDIIYTLKVFQKIYPKFMAWSGNHVLLEGLIQSCDALMPVTSEYSTWLNNCANNAETVTETIKELLKPMCDEIVEDWKAGVVDPIDYPENWSNLDWKLGKPKGWRKRKPPEDYPIVPKWYNSMYLLDDFKWGGNDLPRLLRLVYNGQPMEYNRKDGWHTKNCQTGLVEKLPHSTQKEGKSVGNCMVRYYIGFVEDNYIYSEVLDKADLIELMLLLDSTSIWSSYKDRMINAEIG